MNDKTHELLLLRQADRARARLLAVADRLDAKRQQLAHPIVRVKQEIPRPIVLAGLAGAGALVGGAIAYAVVRRSARRRASAWPAVAMGVALFAIGKRALQSH